MKRCGTCKHWQGNESTYMAACALEVPFAPVVAFDDELAERCAHYDDGTPLAPAAQGGPVTNYWGHFRKPQDARRPHRSARCLG